MRKIFHRTDAMNRRIRSNTLSATQVRPIKRSISFTLMFGICLLSGCATLRNSGPMAKGTRLARQLSDKGREAIHLGDWSKAEKHFKDALRHCPKDRFVREQYANCLKKRGDAEGAIQQLQEAIAISQETDAALLVELGRVYFLSGNITAANDQADLALRAEPAHAKAWQLKGEIQRRSGQTRQALTSFHRALAAAPNDISMQLAAAESYYELGLTERTLASLDRLLEQDRQVELPAQVFHLRGLAFDQLGDTSDAVEQLAIARDRSNYPSASLLIDLASAQMKDGQFEEADASALEAMRIATPSQNREIASLRNEIAKLQPKFELIR